jgi:hypothetical protein
MTAVKRNPIGTCRLCHSENLELRDSHLVLSAAYKVLEEAGGCISVNTSNGVLKPNQWSAYLLCADCEERFNKGGEDWVLRNSWRRDKFKLAERLEKAIPSKTEAGFNVFEASEVSDANADQLEYFAASLFWKASCHDWGYEQRSALGLYQEAFRKFLLGNAPWPEKAWLTVGCVPTSRRGACMTFGLPKLDSNKSYSSHRVGFLGIVFLLSIGNLVPKEARIYSIQNRERFIVMGEAITFMVMNDVSAFRNAEYKGKAKELTKAIFRKNGIP